MRLVVKCKALDYFKNTFRVLVTAEMAVYCKGGGYHLRLCNALVQKFSFYAA